MVASLGFSVLKVPMRAASCLRTVKVTQLSPRRRYRIPALLAHAAIVHPQDSVLYTMASFDDEFKVAANPGPKRKIPGAVLLAADRSGQIRYHNAQGFTSVDESVSKPLTADTTFLIASCTKLMTTICALQCVEKGLLALDEDVSAILPELKSRQIITGFDSTAGNPIFTKATKKITLRQLLSHSSGMGYDFLSPTLGKWREWTKVDQSTFHGDILEEYSMPLVYEPGEGWEYSCSIDWAGIMIERVNGGIRLEAYMKEHLWDPLGMDSTTFHLTDTNRSIQDRLCSSTARAPSGALVPSPYFRTYDPKDDLGGGGLYSSPHDYLKVLTMLLQNDGKILKQDTVDLMFQPQLPDAVALKLKAKVSGDDGAMYRAGVTSDAWNFGLGGILNMEDVDGVCKRGTMTWGGLPNLYWWIDPAAGSCGFYASQVLPPADPISMDMSVAFRKDAYRKMTFL